MRASFVKHLVCPKALTPLRLEAGCVSGDCVLEGRLVGPGGGYPIAQGIASFVDESASDTQTVRSFAQKWSAHKYYRK
ncbi:MAG: hypothetical protein PVI86_19860, partial [Phycisphaerae bacterium]